MLAVSDEDDPRLIVGDLMLDEDSHEVTRAGEQIDLTATEFELLRYLMRNERVVLSKSGRVWTATVGEFGLVRISGRSDLEAMTRVAAFLSHASDSAAA